MAMTGRQGGSMVGSLIGAITFALIPYVGPYIAPIGGLIGGFTGGMVGAAISPDKALRPDTLSGIDIQTSALGMPIPQIFGQGAGTGNVFFLGPLEVIEHDTASSGKGNPATTEYVTDISILLCDTRISGPMSGIRTIKTDGDLVYDRKDGEPLPTGVVLHYGTAVQAPSAMITAHEGAGNVPGLPYHCYMDWAGMSMGSYPRVPNITVELYQGNMDMEIIYQMRWRSTDNSIWAAAPHVGQVLVYDATTQNQTDLVSVYDGPGNPFATPVGFPIGFEGGEGALWVARPAHYQLVRLDVSSKLITHTFDVIYSLLGGAFWHEGTMWFTAYDYATNIGYLLRVSTASPFVTTIACGQAAGGIRKAVAISPTIVWVTDNRYPTGGGNSGVMHIDPTSNTVVNTIEIGADATTSPIDIVATADGHIWVADNIANSVKRFSTAPLLVATIAIGASPLQMAVASDGYVWVASSLNRGTLYRINPATNTAQAFESLPLTLLNQAQTLLTPGASGSMWVLSRESSCTQHFSSNGTSVVISTGGTPQGQVAESTTHVWTGTTRGEVRRITEANVVVDSDSTEGPRLKGTLTRLCEAAGIPAAQLTMAGIINPLVAFRLNAVQSARSVVDLLCLGYQLIGFESNRGMKFRSREPGAVVATIPEIDLDAHNDEDSQSYVHTGLNITVIPDQQIPTTLEVSFVNRAREYQQDVQPGYTSNHRAAKPLNSIVVVPLVMTPSFAKRLAQGLINRLWLQRQNYQTTVNRQYMALEPGDLVQVKSRSLVHRFVLTETAYQRPGLLTLQGAGDIYESLAFEGFVGHTSTGSRLAVESHTTGHLLNLPALSSADQVPRLHVAYSYPGARWPGATLLRSVDSGVSYAELASGAGLLATTGVVAAALAAGTPYVFDLTTTFSVVLDAGSAALVSISDAQLLAGGNPVQIGDEVLCFGEQTLTGTRTYTCSRLLRGLQGTELAISTHGTNERLTFLNAAVHVVPISLSERGIARQYKTVTRGLDASTVTPNTFTADSDNLQSWAVGTPQAYKPGADWVLTWLARSRFSGAWVDGVGFGYDPDFSGQYRVRIFTDATFTTVARTIFVAANSDPEALQTTTYTAAQQVTDFGGAVTTLYWRVRSVGAYGVGQYSNVTSAA